MKSLMRYETIGNKQTTLSFFFKGKSIADIKTSITYVNNKAEQVTLNYTIDTRRDHEDHHNNNTVVKNGETVTRHQIHKYMDVEEREYK